MKGNYVKKKIGKFEDLMDLNVPIAIGMENLKI